MNALDRMSEMIPIPRTLRSRVTVKETRPPTLVAAAGNPNVVSELLTGKKVGDQTFKVHLDGYDQLDLITGKRPSARHEIFYLTETIAAVRIDDFVSFH